MNASTFTARVIASTGADVAAALSGAIGAMSGPLHGGAPSRVLGMIEDVERLGDARKYVKDLMDRGERLMGFGHRVYRAEDPRARTLRRTAKELGAPRYAVALELEKAALAALVNQASYFLMTGNIPKRMGSLHPNIAPYGELVRTQDEKWIVLAVGSDDQFRKLCGLLSNEEVSLDIRFTSNTARVKNRIALQEILQNEFQKILCSTFELQAQLNGIPYGRVRNMKEVFEREAASTSILKEVIEGHETQRTASVAFSIRMNE